MAALEIPLYKMSQMLSSDASFGSYLLSEPVQLFTTVELERKDPFLPYVSVRPSLRIV